MLIHNYGLFWDKDKAHFGRKGSIKGVHIKAKKDGKVEFKDQQGIYALYDTGFNLVYIGQTGIGNQKLLRRLIQHQRDHLSQRWKYFSWFGLCSVNETKKLKDPASANHVERPIAMNHLEAIAISIAEPKLNLQGGKFGKKCEQYYQVDTCKKNGEVEDEEED